MRFFRKFSELFRVQDGPRGFQRKALKTYQSAEAIRKPIISSAEEDYFK
jgi:hypothetical protein